MRHLDIHLPLHPAMEAKAPAPLLPSHGGEGSSTTEAKMPLLNLSGLLSNHEGITPDLDTSKSEGTTSVLDQSELHLFFSIFYYVCHDACTVLLFPLH